MTADEHDTFGLDCKGPEGLDASPEAMPAVDPGPGAATRTRILEATRQVLARNGRRKLSLSDVASEAGTSRPTLYRWFADKQALLAAFGVYEQENFDDGLASAIHGRQGPDRLDAALRFIVEFQDTYAVGRMGDVEPHHVLSQMNRVIPIMRDRLRHLIPGPDSDIAAAAIVRIAVSHYVVAGDDAAGFLAQLRHTAGLDHPR